MKRREKFPIKRTIVFSLLFLLGVVLFVRVVQQIGLTEIIDGISSFGVVPFIGFASISLINFALYVYRWKRIINDKRKRKEQIGFFRLYMHRMTGYAGSYLTPAAQVGGEPLRAALIHEDGIDGKKAASSVVIDLAFDVTALILFIIAGAILAAFEGVLFGQSAWLFALGILIICTMLGYFYYATISGKGFFRSIFRALQLHRLNGLHRIDDWLEETESHITDFFGKKPKLLIFLLFLSIVMISFKAVEIWYIAYFLGETLSFSQAFLASTLPGITLLIPVPGGLGFLEAGTAGVFALLGIGINAITVVFLIRMRDVLFVFLGLTHASGHILRYFKKQFRIK